MAAGHGKNMRASALEASFGKTPVVAFPVTNIYLSLHTGNPGDDGQTSNEVTTTTSGYARQNVVPASWGNAVVGANDVAVTISNTAIVTFGPSSGANAAWGAVTFLGAWKTLAGVTAADFLGRIPITPTQTVTAAGQSVVFAASAITFTDNSS